MQKFKNNTLCKLIKKVAFVIFKESMNLQKDIKKSYKIFYQDHEIKLLVFINTWYIKRDYPFDIYADSSPDDIMLNIDIFKKVFTEKDLNKLNAEIAGTLRHEFEHIFQYSELYDKPKIISRGNLHIIQYLSEKYEIDAFLYDLKYQLKYLKNVTMDDLINELFNKYSVPIQYTKLLKRKWNKRMKIIMT